MIAIVDYGLGNILAFSNMFKRMNVDVRVARSAAELTDADKIILPGVGAFDHAVEMLQSSGMRASLDELVLEKKVPVLGVCVGMQILGKDSDEGRLPGLGWIDGHVRAFKDVPATAALAVPHMGWNDVRPKPHERLFAQMEDDARFYFLHSFYFESANDATDAATASYGIDFCCAVRSENVYGVQFHPEKSHHWGSRLLQNFAEL